MRTLITGATGFVGANLAMRMLRDGHDIHVLLRKEASLWRLEHVKVDLQIHWVNFQDQESLKHVIAEIRPQWVLHLAAYGAYSSQTDLNQMIQTNIMGTANLLQACEQTGVDAFINTGSSSEYGFKTHAAAEDEWLEPNSYYAITKATATHLSKYLAERVSFPVLTLRLYSVYGPFEDPNRLIPTLLKHGLQGNYPPLVSPETARDFVYVDDVVDAYYKALITPNLPRGAIYNIGSGIQTKLGELVQVVRELFTISDDPEWESMAARLWDTNVWIADITRARQELGWVPKYSLKDGLRKMTGWLHDHQDYVDNKL
jgi:UDP-glucose 4-epimerase